MHKYVLPLLLCLMTFLFACEPASLETPGKEYGVGIVKDFNIDKNLRVAVFQKSSAKDGKVELNYGAMDAHFVTIDDVMYMVDWNDLQDFKNLKQGDKLNFRSSGWEARVEKTGKMFKVIRLNEL
jgi:hypothetical protein